MEETKSMTQPGRPFTLQMRYLGSIYELDKET